MAQRTDTMLLVAGLGIAGLVLAGLAAGGVVLAMGGAGMSAEASAIVVAYGISPALGQEIVNVARAVGTEPYWLADLIHYESAKTFDPAVRNPSPDSTATGLIQFTEPTAGKMNTTTANLANLTAVEQMAWVRHYLELVSSGVFPDDPRAFPLDTPQRLFMSVFEPKSRDWPLDREFSATIQARNPGISTPGDYISKVFAIGKTSGLVGT